MKVILSKLFLVLLVVGAFCAAISQSVSAAKSGSATLPQSPGGQPPSPSPDPTGPLVAVDSAGKVIGNVISITGYGGEVYPVVVLKSGDLLALVQVAKDFFIGIEGGQSLYFETLNCTGTPYMTGTDQSTLAGSVVTLSGNVYAHDIDSTRQEREILSILDADGTCDSYDPYDPDAPNDPYDPDDGYGSQVKSLYRALLVADTSDLVAPFKIVSK